MAEHTWKYIEDNAAFLENISLERVVLDVLKIPLHFLSNITLIEELCSKLSKRVCTPVANGLSFFNSVPPPTLLSTIQPTQNIHIA